MSLFAKQKGVKMQIVKISKQYGDELLSGLGLYTAVGIPSITVNNILNYVASTDYSLVYLPYENVELYEYVVSSHSKILKKQLRGLKISEGSYLCAILVDNQIIIPDKNTQIKPNMRVLIMSNQRNSKEIEKLFMS
jgi:Trk K+ transport system NAD-binding subunit